MFNGLDFVYDGVPSEAFGFKIVELDGGVREDQFGISYNILSDKIRLNPVPYFYGAEIEPNLSFSMTIAREHHMDGFTMRSVDRWLSAGDYQILKIVQDDLSDIEFNCMFLEKQKVQYGNLAYAIRYTVYCDSPYAYIPEYTTTWTFTSAVNAVNFVNHSNVNDYVYPTVYAKLSSSATSFSIVNANDDNRSFSMTGLQTSEILTIDGRRGIITSSTALNRIGDSNKLWLRLVPGVNALTITGLQEFRITAKYPIAL